VRVIVILIVAYFFVPPCTRAQDTFDSIAVVAHCSHRVWSAFDRPRNKRMSNAR